MGEKTVLIAQENKELASTQTAVFNDHDFNVLCVPKDGYKVLDTIVMEKPDAVIMDTFLSGCDALEVLTQLQSINMKKKPVIAVLSNIDDPVLERELLSKGMDYLALMPFDNNVLAQRIRQLIKWKSLNPEKINILPQVDTRPISYTQVPEKPEEFNLDMVVSDVLQQIGVPAHVKGYTYLREAIIDSIQDESMMDSITKNIYPTVAKTCNTTASRVERAIRHAIEIAWERGDLNVLTAYFGHSAKDGKPTNGELIAVLSDKLRLKYFSSKTHAKL